MFMCVWVCLWVLAIWNLLLAFHHSSKWYHSVFFPPFNITPHRIGHIAYHHTEIFYSVYFTLFDCIRNCNDSPSIENSSELDHHIWRIEHFCMNVLMLCFWKSFNTFSTTQKNRSQCEYFQAYIKYKLACSFATLNLNI